MVTVRSKISQDLKLQGWASLSVHSSSDLRSNIVAVAQDLGAIVARRPDKPIDTILPSGPGTARQSTLSHQYGLGALPLHSDTAHWTVPCRYIVLACAEIGTVNTPTLLVNADDPSFSPDERLLLRSSTFLIKNGRKSFYSSLIDRKQRFTRFCPACMTPLTDSGMTAMNLYSMERQRDRVVTHRWEERNVLIIDNWRMLHGRGNETPADPLRRLLRVYVQ